MEQFLAGSAALALRVAESFVVIGLIIVIGVVLSLNSQRIAGWIVRAVRSVPGRDSLTEDRQATLKRLYASLVTAAAILLVLIGVLRVFVEPSQIIWIIGLFSAGFGLGARVLVADLIAGTTYIFSNTYAIGEKVEFTAGANKVDGVVEDVNMRSTLLRARTGELFTIPNGEIGVIRNFTRAPFSGAQIAVPVPTPQLDLAVRTLQAEGERAFQEVDEQIEPWTILVVGESIGRETLVTVQGKFQFGQAAAQKVAMAQRIHDCLGDAGIEPGEV